MAKQPLTEESVVELGAASSVDALVQMGYGDLRMTGGAESLLQGHFEYSVPRWKPEVRYSIEDGVGSLSIKEPDAQLVRGPSYIWDLSLGGGVPLDLALRLGAGKADIRLGDVALRTLNGAVGSGEVAADLSGDLGLLSDVALNVASGRMSLALNGGYPALEDLQIRTASGLVDMVLGGVYERLRQLVVQGASGDVNIGMSGAYPALECLVVDNASGTVDMHFGGALAQDLLTKVNCVSGQVMVRYPVEAGVSVHFTSVTGQVEAPDFRREGRRYVNTALGQASTNLTVIVSSVSGKLILQPVEA